MQSFECHLLPWLIRNNFVVINDKGKILDFRIRISRLSRSYLMTGYEMLENIKYLGKQIVTNVSLS